MTKYKIAFVLLLTFLFVSCDPTFSVDFMINNQSKYSLQIISKNSTSPKDTNFISNNTKLVLFNSFGIGSNTDNYLDRLTILPFDELIILNPEGKRFRRNSLDLKFWEKVYPNKHVKYGIVKLTVFDVDFE